VENYQVLDQLTLLVDKSLVVAENTSGRTRYRLLETVRQYALEKLGESGEADRVRGRHRIATRPWRHCSTLRHVPAMSSVSSRPKPRSTTCGPHSRGAAKVPISGLRRSWGPHCQATGPGGQNSVAAPGLSVFTCRRHLAIRLSASDRRAGSYAPAGSMRGLNHGNRLLDRFTT
jgi:hypothetical protein